MKILFIVEKDVKHGAAISGKYLIKGLIERHHDVTIIVPSNIDDISFYEDLNCSIVKVPFVYSSITKSDCFIKNGIKVLFRGIQYNICNTVSFMILLRYLDHNIYDVIHSNSSRIDIGGFVSMKKNIPLIWHVREFGDNDFDRISLNKNQINLMNRCDGYVVGVSQAVCDHWIKKGIKTDKIRRIYNGIPDLNIKEKQISREGNTRFVIVGTIAQTKGQEQVIEALGLLSEMVNCTVDFVGDGNEQYIVQLRRKAKKLCVEDKVKFIGYKSEFYKELYKYDCGLMCSKSEGFGRVTVEYMMAGIPVIASNTGANKELVVDGENGYLYKYNNIVDLKEKMLKICYDKKNAYELGKRGLERARKYFSINTYIDSICRVYFEATGKNYE